MGPRLAISRFVPCRLYLPLVLRRRSTASRYALTIGDEGKLVDPVLSPYPSPDLPLGSLDDRFF